jgi:hypothetical protein
MPGAENQYGGISGMAASVSSSSEASAWQVHRQLARKALYRKVKMAKSNESGVIGANENSESMRRRGEKREEMAKRRQRRNENLAAARRMAKGGENSAVESENGVSIWAKA